MLSASLMVTTKQKLTVGKQKLKKWESNIPVWKNNQYQERKERTMKQPENSKMTTVSPYILITTLNVYGLSFPIKKHRVTNG